MTTKKYTNPATIALHAGWRKDETTNSVTVPIHMTSSYQFDNTDHAANLFALSELGNIYSRIMNPTNAVFEERVAELEGGVAALGLASGQAASAYAIQNLCSHGDNFVASSHLYGGTYNQFKNPFSDMGIEVRFVDPSDPQNFLDATDDKTRAYYGEVLPNPSFQVFPLQEVADLGRPLGIPLIVDNTAAPLICRPFDNGAAIILHSATKYIGGHGTSIGGVLVDGGNFDWEAHPERQPKLNQPDPNYNGVVWTEAVKALGPIAYILKARTTLLRDMGAAMSPFNAWVMLKGLETISLRCEAQAENAEKIVNALKGHKNITRILYPTDVSHPQYELAISQMTKGGTVVSFELSGGKKAAFSFLNALEIITISNNLGDAKSLATHPVTTTHKNMAAEAREAAGITDGFVRLSVGIEDPEDLIVDLLEALEKV